MVIYLDLYNWYSTADPITTNRPGSRKHNFDGGDIYLDWFKRSNVI